MPSSLSISRHTSAFATIGVIAGRKKITRQNPANLTPVFSHSDTASASARFSAVYTNAKITVFMSTV